MQRTDPLNAKAFRSGVELADQLVDDGQLLVRRQHRGQLVHADDVGEDDGHVLVVLGDRLFALPVALHHGFGHQRQHQAVVFPPLFGEQLLLDRQISAHLVESDCEIAEFVTRLHGQRHAVLARADPLGTRLEPPDRPHEQTCQQHRRDADHEDDHRRREHQCARERRHRREGLGCVDLGDDGPVQALHVDRRVGLQRLVTQVVVGDQGAALSSLRQLRGFGRDRLHKSGPVLPDRFLGHIGRSAGLDDVALECFRILEEQAGIRAHQIVGTDDERLTGLAHPATLPTACPSSSAG